MSRSTNIWTVSIQNSAARFRVFDAVLAIALLCPALWGRPQHDEAAKDKVSVLGTWRGQSKCMVKPSGCHDEDSVYRISAGQTPDKVRLIANKIIDGREVNMGDGDCNFDAKTKSIDCPLPNGNSMHLEANGAVIDGSMTLHDGTLWRKISLQREESK